MIEKMNVTKIPPEIVDRILHIAHNSGVSLDALSFKMGISSGSCYDYFFYKKRDKCRPWMLDKIKDFIKQYDNDEGIKILKKEVAINGNK